MVTDMNTENDLSKAVTRPVFRFLAGFLGVFFLLVGGFAAVVIFGSTGTARLQWISEAACFLFMGAAFIHAAFAGRWGPRRQ